MLVVVICERERASLMVIVIKLSATTWGRIPSSCIQLDFGASLVFSQHVLLLLDNVHFDSHVLRNIRCFAEYAAGA